MTLVKLILDADGMTVTHHAWASPNNTDLVGKQDGNGYTYFDVSNHVDDPYVQGIDVPDGHTKLINGELVVDADYTSPVMEMPNPMPSARDQINAQLLKQTATNAAANAAIMKQIATMAAGYTTTAATTQEA